MSRKSRTLRRVLLLALAVYLICSVAAVQVMNAALFGRADEPKELTVRYEDVAADYPRQTVTFSSGSAQLTGWLYPAEDAAALVVIAHGLGADAEVYLPETMHFVDEGYSVLTYDATGTGASGGSGTRGLAQSALDLDAALTRAEQEGLPILLFGHSWGGYAAAAVLQGQRRHDVTASVCAAGFDTPLGLMRQTARRWCGPVAELGVPFLWLDQQLRFGTAANVSGAETAAASGVPVLVLHGADGSRHHPGRRSEPAGGLSKRERAEHPASSCPVKRTPPCCTMRRGAATKPYSRRSMRSMPPRWQTAQADGEMVRADRVCSGARCARPPRERKNVAALRERLAGWQYLRHKFIGATPPSLSLRGGQRPTRRPKREARGSALGVQSRSTRLNRGKAIGQVATAFPKLPRQGGAVVHQRPPTVELLPTGRSLSAATGPVGGGCHLNDSLCESFVQQRERHAAPLQWRVRSIPPIITRRPGMVTFRAAVFYFGYTAQWRGAGASGSASSLPQRSAHRRCGSRSCPRRAWHRSRCRGQT